MYDAVSIERRTTYSTPNIFSITTFVLLANNRMNLTILLAFS